MKQNKNFVQILLVFTIVLTACASCMVGPNYKTPSAAHVPPEWQKEEGGAVSFLQQEPQANWWKVFQDPLLSKYMELGMENNKDLLSAEANILKARALRQVAASKFYPQVGFDANASRTEYSKNGPLVTETAGAGPMAHAFQLQNLFNILFDASWELDLFGKTRRSVQAAEANIGSSIEQKNNLLISIMGEVARNYFEIRSFQMQKELVEQDIALLQQSAHVEKQNFTYGYRNLLDLDRIEAQLSQAQAELPTIIASIYRGIYALSALTGHLPETFTKELLIFQPLPKPPLEVAVGLRSDLLRRRPDVRKAERDLAAATANIGVAVADFYPNFVLGANAGLQSLKIANLFQLPSKTWEYGGDVTLPVFKGGKLVGNLRVAKAETAVAAYTYQQTVLNALSETESAIKNYKEDLSSAHSQKQSVEKTQMVTTLSQEQYANGLVNIIDFINTKRTLIASEKILLSDDTRSLLDLVILYKALGGGWQTAKEDPLILKVLDTYTKKH